MPQNSPAVVTPTSFLTLHYRLSGPQGNIINTFGGKPATLALGEGRLAPTLEAQLLGLPEGAHTTLQLDEGLAFGPHNPDMLQWVARSLMNELGDPQERYQVGEVVQFPAPNGIDTYAGTVLEVQAERLLFDFNHPLAGQPVEFEVQLIGIL